MAYRRLVWTAFHQQALAWLICIGFGLLVAVLYGASLTAIRYKMILAFALSLALSVIGVNALLILAYGLRDFPLFGAILRLARDSSSAMPIALITGIALFVVIFFALSSETIRFIEELHAAIHEISNGDFAVAVPGRTQDELGRLAEDLSAMVLRLRTLIRQERNAEQAKYDLITSVSHDLRTPLTSILGYLALVDNDQYVDEVELRHYVAVAHSKGRQLQRMIDQLFEFTRTSHGAVRLHSREVNLAELIEQLAEEFVPQLQSAGMNYNLRLPSGKVVVPADPDLLVRVFENLISNAIRYGEVGSVIDLELERADTAAVVRVISGGEPIPEADLPRLFESFYRVEKSRSVATGGAGLGLAIAKNIVDLHKGTIIAYAGTDQRNVFEVRLPLNSQS